MRHATTLGGLAQITLLANGPSAPVAAGTLDVADLTAAYKVSVPVEVTRLDYYGRELEIWAEVETMARLKATASGMRHQWDTVRLRVEGKNLAEAEKFEALVARVERARTPKEYSPLASRVLEEVDHLESVFQG